MTVERREKERQTNRQGWMDRDRERQRETARQLDS
jgi:hypothetical protein